MGNEWGRCDPSEPKNRRRRVSILVEEADTRILVDTSPDLREQLLDTDVSDLDAVIWTHDHAAHCHGINDLRQRFHVPGAPLARYAAAATLAPTRTPLPYSFAGTD